MATQKRLIRVTTNDEGVGAAGGTIIGTLAGMVISTTLASANVTVKRTVNGVDQTLLSLTGVSAGGFYHPQTAIHDPTDGSVIEGVYSPFVLDGEQVTVMVSEAGEVPGTLTVTVITYT